MKCKICGMEVEDMFKHWDIDEKHKGIVEGFDYLCEDECCLCGGRIRRHCYGDEDNVGWNITCEQCDFLYAED